MELVFTKDKIGIDLTIRRGQTRLKRKKNSSNLVFSENKIQNFV
jgi:hypothetical protein